MGRFLRSTQPASHRRLLAAIRRHNTTFTQTLYITTVSLHTAHRARRSLSSLDLSHLTGSINPSIKVLQSHTSGKGKPHPSTAAGGQQTLRHQVTQAWEAVWGSPQTNSSDGLFTASYLQLAMERRVTAREIFWEKNTTKVL